MKYKPDESLRRTLKNVGGPKSTAAPSKTGAAEVEAELKIGRTLAVARRIREPDTLANSLKFVVRRSLFAVRELFTSYQSSDHQTTGKDQTIRPTRSDIP